jgi:long-chain acyl-CoA synthetase
MAKDSRVMARIREEVNVCNKAFNSYEQIKRFALLDHDWTVESGELTPSLKKRRAVIMEKYKEVIETLFA